MSYFGFRESDFDMLNLPYHLQVSREKRTCFRKEQRKKRMDDMRAALPVLNIEGIRRYRMPYYKAILINLKEHNYPSTANYLEQLIDFQEKLREDHGPDTKVWVRPRLCEENGMIDHIISVLKGAEDAHYEEKYGDECDALLELSVQYSFGPEEWWWLGEQFLIQTVDISAAYHGDGGKRNAKSRYLLGKFALENAKDIPLAKKNLLMSRSLALGKTWVVRKIENDPGMTIYMASCKLLYKTLMKEAEKIMKIDARKASAICSIALRRAVDACDYLGVADVLMLQGKCELILRDYERAIAAFEQATRIYLRFNQGVNVCQARIQLAIAYLASAKFVQALDVLKNLNSYAVTHKLKFYEGQAYRFLGEYYLNAGNPRFATPILIQALNTFHEMDCVLETDQVRNLAAVSAGQEMMPEYTDIILKCVGNDKEVMKQNLNKLLMWKDEREIFWKEDESVSSSSLSAAFSGNVPNWRISSYDLLQYFQLKVESNVKETKYDQSTGAKRIRKSRRNLKREDKGRRRVGIISDDSIGSESSSSSEETLSDLDYVKEEEKLPKESDSDLQVKYEHYERGRSLDATASEDMKQISFSNNSSFIEITTPEGNVLRHISIDEGKTKIQVIPGDFQQGKRASIIKESKGQLAKSSDGVLKHATPAEKKGSTKRISFHASAIHMTHDQDSTSERGGNN